ncbi:MAG: ABC transporter permease [Rhodospirillaceae bacterium]|nr:ABC transporter permease [Rhodospirillaceae bacterium]MDE0255742.1 ABC transporter permease [Rhodospirillaceae bacterium]MDE0619950.1 ABC transporter permease [Rhodospirillaceae bacterium]MXY41448.1 ABC transporter permease [Rhodospirillaceae bacterium]MYF08109.1 ABC transporter permease [Rhodospirillaceae bacterium]
MPILRLVLERIAYAFIVVTAVLVLNFILVRLAPGDPAEVIAGESGGITEEILAAIRRDYGLDLPIHEQLWIYLGNAVQGDLGYSFYFNSPVVELVVSRMGPTILLILAATVIALFIGTALGVLASRNPEGLFSNFLTVASLIGYSAPAFWTGLMLIILFAFVVPLFPVAGLYDVTLSVGYFGRALDIAHHLVLPAFTLAIIYIAQYSRLARASMLEVLGSDYIRTARAKGVAERVVFFKHALRNAILPIITITGLHFGNLLSGAVLVEAVFNWPGLGTLAFDSLLRRDYTTILALLFFSALMVIVANLATDFCYRLADPRIKGKRG